jgi:hypothetical protein
MRTLVAIVGGLFVWFLVAIAGNAGLRFLLAGYSSVETSMQFTLGMMIARLLLGALASVGAGYATSWISKKGLFATLVVGALLTAMFVPVHYGLWDKFPIWYHIVFLTSIVPMTVLGAIVTTRRNELT